MTKNARRAAVLCLISVLLMFALSSFTGPLYPNGSWGGDSAIFRLMGRSAAAGKTLYKDIFDHKGPVLFYIEALGESMGRYGAFTLQCVFCVFSVLLCFGTCLRARDNGTRAVVCTVTAFAYFFMIFDKGNLSEDISLPFISVCVLLFVKYGASGEDRHPVGYAYVYGVSLMALALMRLNNAVTVCAVILAAFIRLIVKKQTKNLWLNLLFGVLGMLTVALPVCLVFARRGALGEMLNATFLYNFKYTESNGTRRIVEFLRGMKDNSLFDIAKDAFKYRIAVRYIPLLVSAFLWLRNALGRRKRGEKLSVIDSGILFMLLLNIADFLLTDSYAHYFTVLVPVFCLSLAMYGRNVKWERVICAAMVVVFGVYCAGVVTESVIRYPEQKAERLAVSEDLALISEEEKDSVIGCELPAKYYLYGDILPCYKYYTYQSWWSKADPQIMADFLSYLEEEKPLWILTEAECGNKRVLALLESDYELKHGDEYVMMYRLREEAEQ